MSIRMFMPGHGLYTDTLILYGIALPLCEALEEQIEREPEFVKARSLEQTYELEVQVDDYAKIAQAIADYVADKQERLSGILTSGPLGFFDESDVKVMRQALTDRERLSDYLKSLAEPGHAELRGEGRDGRGKTMKLPLIPMAGKYLHRDLTKAPSYKAAQYKACNCCCALAALGLAMAAFPVLGGMGRELNRVIVVVSFEGEVNADYFRYFNDFHVRSWEDFYRKLRSVKAAGIRATGAAAQLPLRTVMKLVVSAFSPSLVRCMAGAEARWHALGVNFAGRPRAPQVRGFHDLEVTALIMGLNELYTHGYTLITNLFDVLRSLVESGEGHALEAFLDFIATRDLTDLYVFARGAYSAVEWERTQASGKNRWEIVLSQADQCRELAEILLKSEEA